MIHGIIRFIYFYSFDAIDDFAKRDWHRHWMPDFEDLNTSFSEKIGVSAEIGGLAVLPTIWLPLEIDIVSISTKSILR